MTSARVEQGDPIRLRIQAQGPLPEIEVEALVWYDHPAPRTRGKQQRMLGCVLPDRAPAFLDLFAEVERRNAPPDPPRRGAPRTSPRKQRVQDPDPPRAPEPDLPRSRDPLPPPKPEPEESLPHFRVRLRQIGGPRTRSITVQAGSVALAAERARTEISEVGSETERWAVLEVEACGEGRSARPGADRSRGPE